MFAGKGKPPQPVQKAPPKTLAERIRKHYGDKHIEFPGPPLDRNGDVLIPHLPNDITTITSQQLGQLHQRYKAYQDYVAGVLALADIDKLEEEKEEDLQTKRVALSIEASGEGTAAYRKLEAALDPVVVQKRDAALEKKARYVFLKNRVDQLDKDLKLISREQTRRSEEMERARERK